jgi:hypothetical protein
VPWSSEVALRWALERLTAITVGIKWQRGVARRHGAALDGTEPEEDVTDVDRVQYAYDLWEKLHLWPALRADPAFPARFATEIVRLRPAFELLTRPVQPHASDISKILFRRGGVVFAAIILLLSVVFGAVWLHTVTWAIAYVRARASIARP